MSLLIAPEGCRLERRLLEKPRPGGVWWQVTDTSGVQVQDFLEFIKISHHSYFDYELEDGP